MSRKHIVSIVLNSVFGDSRVIKTAKAAENAGYDATILGLSKETDTINHEKIEGTNVILVPNPVHFLKREGLWPEAEFRNLTLYLDLVAQNMLPHINEINPSLLHSHDLMGLQVGASISHLFAANGKHLPWLHDLHEFVAGLDSLPPNYMETCLAYEARYLRKADALVTVSQKLANELKNNYKLRNLPTVIYNCPYSNDVVDKSVGDIRSKLKLSEDTPLVVYIGGANKLRGCTTIVEAVAKLPKVHIAFVSNSPYMKELEQLGNELGIGHRFYRLPTVNSDKVTSFIRTADVGIHGLIHYPNAEVAMPNKLFEYMHAGLPSVVSDVEEMKRFVDKHQIGCVYKAEDVESCAQAIQDAIDKKKHYSSKITSALKSEYSWQSQEKTLAKLYGNLIDNSLWHKSPKPGVLLLTDDPKDDLTRLAVELKENNIQANIGYVGEDKPSFEVDFYLKHNPLGLSAGTLSRISNKFKMIVFNKHIQTFSHLDLLALKESGNLLILRDEPSSGFENCFEKMGSDISTTILVELYNNSELKLSSDVMLLQSVENMRLALEHAYKEEEYKTYKTAHSILAYRLQNKLRDAQARGYMINNYISKFFYIASIEGYPRAFNATTRFAFRKIKGLGRIFN